MDYTKAEAEQIILLRRVSSPTGEQMDLIFNLYKKYVNPAIRSYTTGCSCHNDISTIYWSLMEWFPANENKFIN